MGYRELGLISILIMWGAFAYLLSKWRGHKAMSLSMHASSARHAFQLFAAVLLLSGSLFTVFMYKWFIPEFGLPDTFGHLVLFTMLCLVFTAFIPDKKGTQRTLHRFFAYSLATLLLILTVFILCLCSMSFLLQLAGGFVLGYMFFCIIGLIFLKSFKELYLVFQVGYIVMFQLYVLAVTYLQ